jgi:hypothetical protein
MEKCLLTVYQNRYWISFGQKINKFLPGGIERDYITLWSGIFKTSKIHTEGDEFKFSWYSGLPHSLIHITLFLVLLWLGKRDEIYPMLQPLRIPTHLVYTNNINPPLN